MAARWQTDPDFCLAGQLLAAAPAWQHELFGHSVCLVVHHDASGAVGVVLNRNLKLPTSQFWQQLAGEKPINQRAALNFGGPQAGPVVALHNRKELAEYTSAEGVYFAAQVHNLQQLVTSSANDARVKIIIGQADWSSGQLDREFAEGKWLPLAVSPAVVFADDSEMWPRALRQVGNQFVASITGCHVQPGNILTN